MLQVFNVYAWLDWMHRTVYVMGILCMFIFVGMQVFGWEVTIGLPTIEHVFKKH